MLLVYVALGGAVGAVTRYALAGWIYERAGADFPWGTLAVNLLGSFALGVLLPLLAVQPAQAEWRALVSVGFLGAFTTFSTFSYEAAMLIQDRKWKRAGAYVLASLGLGLASIVAGFAISAQLLR
ncbi:MAG: fluoride efflux transporter CrcB [Gemmatimonadota bacterium]|jgi:CrcB protein|nr:fluoride efflux transporter CrcB [Gemmatimonadota bacterium]